MLAWIYTQRYNKQKPGDDIDARCVVDARLLWSAMSILTDSSAVQKPTIIIIGFIMISDHEAK